jgi:hypothetical protein
MHGTLCEITKCIPYQGSSLYSEECERYTVILEYPHCRTRCVLHIPQTQLDSI